MLELKSIQKKYGSDVVIRDLSLAISSGEFLSILGPSGCGKSTLLRILAGLESPDSGVLCFEGKDITSLAANKRPFNMVFQRYALFPHLSVSQNIAFGPCMRGESSADVAEMVKETLNLVRLDGFGERSVTQLSGGQQQRVALARAIVNRPKVLLLDEPMSALDRNLREELRLDILRIQRTLATTFILVTHDQEEAMAMSDRIAIMKNGALEQVGAPKSIYLEPKTTFVAQTIGGFNEFTVKGRKVYVRPEYVAVRREEHCQLDEDTNKVRAVVREILFKGPLTEIVCEVLDNSESSLVTVSSVSEKVHLTSASVGYVVELVWKRRFQMTISEVEY
jgi:spermidine/putrescine transport system ATP-binding protein